MGRRWVVALALLAAVAAAALVAPWVASGYWLRVFTTIFMLAALAQSVNFIAGLAGYADFGNILYFGLGAYVTGFAMQHGVPAPLAIAAGALCGATIALTIGRPILRLRGHYFAIATLGMLEGTRELVTNLEFLGGGSGMNLPIISLPPREFSALMYYLMLGAAAAISLLAYLVRRSSLGLGLRAIKGDEQAAAVMGIDATRYKTIAWVLAAGCSAVVGGLYGLWRGFIEPGVAFDVVTGTQYFMMMLLGGPGTIAGPILGAFGLGLLDVLIWGQWQHGHLAILGVVIMATVLFLPGGFVNSLRLPRTMRARWSSR
ncbi:MAG: branched-chain amino acid ABC transporter permease [Candidatus Limnocylindria bacterium]|nr:branched-chain amino acid ABC transporter permease [Candidatus Limnocylindria bacterium]